MKYLNKIKSYFLISFTLVSILSCKSEDIASPSSTPIDLTTFISIGNSLTAGFMDGALYNEGQVNSYPELLAKEFKTENSALDFKTPFVGNENGAITGLETVFANRFIFNGTGIARKVGTPGTSLANVYASQGPFHNLGVPGAKSFHLLAAGYGNPAGIAANPPSANPNYVRMASSSTSSMLGDAMLLKPTFFTLWIGNNDVLSYSTSGGNPTKNSSNEITLVSRFNGALGTTVATLTSNGAKGVIANIPNVTDIPYFTAIPANPIPVTSSAAAGGLNSLYTTYNSALQAAVTSSTISQSEADARTINFVEGANYPVTVDSSLKEIGGLKLRQLKAGELILLTASLELAGGKGSAGGLTNPLGDAFTLTATEISNIKTATTSYNSIIKNLATKYDLAFFDANAFLNQLSTTGLTYNSVTYNSKFFPTPNTGFSLDGVHPNAKGYAIIANGFIKAINSHYKKNFKEIDPTPITVSLN